MDGYKLAVSLSANFSHLAVHISLDTRVNPNLAVMSMPSFYLSNHIFLSVCPQSIQNSFPSHFAEGLGDGLCVSCSNSSVSQGMFY